MDPFLVSVIWVKCPSTGPERVIVVLTVAILVGAGAAALAFALSGRHTTSSGTASGTTPAHSQTAPATTPAVTSSSAPVSPSSSSPSQSTSASASSSSTALPVIIVGSYSGMEPTEIAYSGDSTNVVTGITWASWTATGATGTGTSDIDSCVPSCAAASPNPVTTTITLSGPADGHFTQMTETRNGSTTSYTYPATWAQSAS